MVKNLMSRLSISPHLMKFRISTIHVIGGHVGRGFLLSQSQEVGGYSKKNS